MANVVLKIRPNPYYRFTQALDGNRYRIRINANHTVSGEWSQGTSKWIMSIKGLTNDVEANGIALLPGKDLLAGYGFIELGQLWCYDNSGQNEDPDYDNMGGRWTVEYIPKA